VTRHTNVRATRRTKRLANAAHGLSCADGAGQSTVRLLRSGGVLELAAPDRRDDLVASSAADEALNGDAAPGRISIDLEQETNHKLCHRHLTPLCSGHINGRSDSGVWPRHRGYQRETAATRPNGVGKVSEACSSPPVERFDGRTRIAPQGGIFDCAARRSNRIGFIVACSRSATRGKGRRGIDYQPVSQLGGWEWGRGPDSRPHFHQWKCVAAAASSSVRGAISGPLHIRAKGVGS